MIQVTEHPSFWGTPKVADHSLNPEVSDEKGRLGRQGPTCLEALLAFHGPGRRTTDRDFVTPLYRRLEALERETDELRGRLAQASVPGAERAAG